MGASVARRRATPFVTQVKDGKLFLSASGVELAQPIASLTARDLVDLAGPAMRKLGGEGDLHLGVFLFFEGETERAMKALEEAEAAGVDISCCTKRLAYLQRSSEDNING